MAHYTDVYIIFIPSVLLLLLLLLFSIFLAISSSNWFSLWFRLEINILIFLPLITFNRKTYELESRIKYFLIQRMASLWFLRVIILTPIKLSYLLVILLIRIIIKLGIFPFHGWFFRLIRVASWSFFFLLSTLQKLIPLIILRNIIINSKLFSIIIIISLIFIITIEISYLSVRLILTLSSLNNVGWILLRLQCRIVFWLIYIFIYIWLLAPVTRCMSSISLNFSNIFFNVSSLRREKLIITLCVFSLGGLPPLLGFFNKFIIIKLILIKTSLLIIVIIIFSSLFLLYYYMRIVFSSLSFYPRHVSINNNHIFALIKSMFILSFFWIVFLVYLIY